MGSSSKINASFASQVRFIVLSCLFTVYLRVSCQQVIGWMLNLAICLVCLVKIFVHGDPIVYESDMDEYYAYRKKADRSMKEVRRSMFVAMSTFPLFTEAMARRACLLSAMLRQALRVDGQYHLLLSTLIDLAADTFRVERHVRRSLVDILVGLDKVYRYA